MTDYSRDLAGAEHFHNAQAERPERPSQAEWDDRPTGWECPYSGEMCRSDLCIPACQNDDIRPWDFRDPADDEPEHSVFVRVADGDPMFQVLCTVANGGELEARDAYGDQAVDRAIQRVLDEEGF